jgi:ABC-type polysaccharide/polyol phosphate export permease
MLALQAAARSADSLRPLLIIAAVFIALFWKAVLKIIFILLVTATLVTVTFGAATVLSILGHVIK